MNRLLNLMWSKWYHWKCEAREWVAKHAPKIPTRRPEPPGCYCLICDEPCNKICAHNTGDGWAFSWECPNNCGFGDPDMVGIYDWYPFWFGACCNGKDLKRLGIEVV